MKNRFNLDIARGMDVVANHPRGGDVHGTVTKLARMAGYGWRATLDSGMSVALDDIKSADRRYFFAEVTDTFGGDANYSWVRRYKVRADTLRRAISLVSQDNGYSFRHDYGTADDSARYNARGAAVCAFVSHWDEDSHSQYSHVQTLGE